ncbi:MAG: DUF2304 family protein, partial [Proteobacteria bacterium]|nr:DUF2304 family protein [Pseudomonadota bacterium]
MGIWLIALCVLGLIYVFFQFGGRVAASRALPWWFVAVFVALAATKPELFAAVSQFLGIRYVSNFVLAGLVMFLFAQTFEAAGLISKLQRQIRGVETGVASKTYKPIGPGLKYLVIFPCFNESKSLPMLSDSIRTLCASHPSVGICFINDGSSDNTDSVLSSLQLPHVAHSCNLGVSAALLTGFKIATSIKTISAVIQCDSDGQHPIHEIPDLIKSFNHQYADCIVGSRFLDNKSLSRIRESTSPLRRFGGMIISSILWITSRGRISINDPTSG